MKKKILQIPNHSWEIEPEQTKSLGYGIGQEDGFWIEWDVNQTAVVIKLNGDEYKQTLEQFINNCKKT